ncbi:hypothetical protein MBANPS3_002495 [Mucor bainieri]
MEQSGDTIPTEILQLVFEKLEGASLKDFTEMQLVCRRWCFMAQERIYREIAINKHLYERPSTSNPKSNDYDCGKGLKKECDQRTVLLARTIDSPNGYIGSLIEKLAVASFTVAKKNYLPTFVKACPNLLSLQCHGVPVSLYKDLLDFHQKGYLQHLERLTLPIEESEEPQCIDPYNQLALCLKGTLKELLVACSHQQFITVKNSFPLFEELHNFPKVEDLHVVSNNSVLLYEFDELLDNCSPCMQSVTFYIDNYDNFPIYEYLRTDLSKIASRRLVKKLTITCSRPLVTTEVAFLMLKFTALSTFTLACNEFDPFTMFEGDPNELMRPFLKFLIKIPELKAKGLAASGPTAMRSLPVVADAISIKKLTMVPLTQYTNEVIYMDVEHSQSKAALDMEATDKKKTYTSTLRLQYACFSMESYCRKTLQLFKDTVENLYLGPEELYYEDDEGTDIRLQLVEMGRWVPFVLDNYALLKVLRLQNLTIPLFKSEPTSNPLRFDSIIMDNCIVESDVLTQMSQRIKYVDFIIVHNLKWFETIESRPDSINFHMPYTAINKFRLHMRRGTSIVKVFTGIHNRYLHSVSQPRKLKFITAGEYTSLASKMVFTVKASQC